MRRIVLIGCLLCVGTVAMATPANPTKPKVAVLGLEVVTVTGTPDPATVRVAADFTVALRLRPKAGQGPWRFAPGSDKELLDEKLLEDCENEAAACMAKIGAKLGTDLL